MVGFWRWGGMAVSVAAIAGCAPQPSPVAVSSASPIAASPTPRPTPTPINIAAQVDRGEFALFGTKGERMTTLRAKSAGFDPRSLSRTLTVNDAKATLYDKKPPNAAVSELSADVVTADREKRTLTATGNATVRSLTEKGTPTLRADRMVWSFDAGTVTGDGNVLLTAAPDFKATGKSFSADSRLRTFNMKSDGRPATGGTP